jgi:hypothetical protein
MATRPPIVADERDRPAGVGRADLPQRPLCVDDGHALLTVPAAHPEAQARHRDRPRHPAQGTRERHEPGHVVRPGVVDLEPVDRAAVQDEDDHPGMRGPRVPREGRERHT